VPRRARRAPAFGWRRAAARRHPGALADRQARVHAPHVARAVLHEDAHTLLDHRGPGATQQQPREQRRADLEAVDAAPRDAPALAGEDRQPGRAPPAARAVADPAEDLDADRRRLADAELDREAAAERRDAQPRGALRTRTVGG
jgi:hypothetical protein